ncbi:unnamed protein product [Ectocarpus sp. 4 AP-2014]
MVPNVGAGDTSEEVVQELNNTEAAATAVETTEPSGVSPAPTQGHVLNCQFGRWHPVFKHCTPRSVVIELPEDVVRYLQQDGVVLPKGFQMSCGEGVRDDSDDEVDWGNEDEDEQNGPEFPDLHALLSDAIASLGGAVFPKLNWSCPKASLMILLDAAWVNGGSLKCKLPGDVLCLIKSSTFISHDLNHAFDACTGSSISRPETFTLVLRKWCNLHPSMLFRCFVRERRLVGVCQRDCTSYYGFLEEEADRLSTLLEEFFAAEVCKKFADPDCVADVYVDNRSRVWLLDINPFSGVTDSLLFDWSEDALAAPLPPRPLTLDQGEETLPSGVAMRIHFDPSPTHGGHASSTPSGTVAAPGNDPSDSQQGPPGGRTRETGVLARATGITLAGGQEERDFEFRCVPSSLHMVPDPMGRYRGPADVGMGTLACGTGGNGGLELEDLIESCRLAEKND